jgi:hypothetical protein
MRFSPKIKKAFDAWVTVETWHTDHILDNQRFYQFVRAVLVYSRKKPSESFIREELLKIWSGKLDEKYLINKINQFTSLYEHLYSFGKLKNKW